MKSKFAVTCGRIILVMLLISGVVSICGCTDENTQPAGELTGTMTVIEKGTKVQDWMFHQGEFQVVTFRVNSIDEPGRSYRNYAELENKVYMTDGDLTVYYNTEVNKTYKIKFNGILNDGTGDGYVNPDADVKYISLIN